MTFLKQIDIDEIKGKLTSDVSRLGKIFSAKNSQYEKISIDHSLVEDYFKDGWELDKELKTKSRLFRPKKHSRLFEDDIWCQLYKLGYRYLNYDDNFKLPYGPDPEDKKQIDVIAIDNETVLLIECKSSYKPKKSPSLKTEFEGLSQRLDGFRKVCHDIFGRGIKVKYIFATRNLRIDPESVEIQRLVKTNSFFYNDNAYDYVNSLIKNYKDASHYQFMGLLFRDQIISKERIEVPAIEGNMGKKKYYMFSLEPHTLLKLGFVLHRTKVNDAEMPTYQRLLVPSRLNGISKFINEGGFFPNSIIINFTERKHSIQFEYAGGTSHSNSKLGTLKIPNAYAIAYIIDGQHRVYGYANTKFKESNTIPVVAFKKLESTEQLEMFMDINQNQKAVKASLRLTLEEDLYWESDRADSRIKALRSSIISELADSANGPLYNRISVGEDSSILSFKAFATALLKSGLLPNAKGNKYLPETSKSCIYNIHNQNHQVEMRQSKKKIVSLLNLGFGYVEENYQGLFEEEQSLIVSNRGVFAFINVIGSLNTYFTNMGELTLDSSPSERFDKMLPVLDSLLKELNNINDEEKILLKRKYGTGGDLLWLRTFQSIINSNFPDYEPDDLIDWKERQDNELQEQARRYNIEIERNMKNTVLHKIELLFKDYWELEINSIKRECQNRAEEEKERQYKEGLPQRDIEWTQMFHINDYKAIIQKYWTKRPDPEIDDFLTFEEEFSIDIGLGFNSKAEKSKWISVYNSLRNQIAHEGTKENGLNREEVGQLERFYNHLI